MINYLFGSSNGGAQAESNRRHPRDTHIELYTALKADGQKASITLEELGVNYEVRKMDLDRGEQREEWFLKINPNGTIPAIVDKTQRNHHHSVFESGCIQLYLCEEYDHDRRISFRHDSREHWQVLEWLFFMNSAVGPFQAELNHFRALPDEERSEYAIQRFQNEVRHLYCVLDHRLGQEMKTLGRNEGPYLVGNKFSIADIANFCWVNQAEYSGVPLEDLHNLCEWRERIRQKRCVKRGLDVPASNQLCRVGPGPGGARGARAA